MAKVKICGKEYEMSASALTPATFKTCFGMEADYVKTFFSVQTKLNDCKSLRPKKLTDGEFLSDIEKEERKLANLKTMEVLYSCLDDVLKIAYCLIKENDINFMDYEEWLKSLSGLFDEPMWLYEVLSIAQTVFRRSLQEQS